MRSPSPPYTLRHPSAAARAVAVARALDHPVYDSFYPALSEAQQATLVSTDRRLIAKVGGTSFARRTLALADFPADADPAG